MKCKNCGLLNADDATHCIKCNTMLQRNASGNTTGGTRALIQILLLILFLIATVGILWVIMHDVLHAV